MKTLIAFVGAALFVLGLAQLQSSRETREAISNLLIERRTEMTTITATWTSGGISHTITTTRRESETAAEWAARHREDLDAALLLFPKDA